MDEEIENWEQAKVGPLWRSALASFFWCVRGNQESNSCFRKPYEATQVLFARAEIDLQFNVFASIAAVSRAGLGPGYGNGQSSSAKEMWTTTYES